MNKKFLDSMLFAVAVCVVVSIPGFILHKNIEKTTFHGDESGWISSGFYYTNLLLKHDFILDHWRCDKCANFGGAKNLHVGQWLMGIPLVELYQGSGKNFFCFYSWNKALSDNKKEGRVPPDDLLFSARRVSAFFGILCCLIVFLIGYHAGNIWVGMASAIFVTTNPLFVRCATLADTDIYYLFFLLCSSLAILFWVKFFRKRFLILAGIFCGLATSVKIIGLPVLVFMVFICLIYETGLKRLKISEAVGQMAIFFLCAVAVVYMCNPFYWGVNFPLKFPMTFIVWDNAFKNEIARRSVGSVDPGFQMFYQHRFRVFHHDLLLRYANFSVEWILLCEGLILAGAHLIGSFFRKKQDFWSIPFIFFLSNYLFILIFMKLNFDRYYLSTVVAGQFMAAYFVVPGSCLLWKAFLEKKMFAWGRNSA